MPVGRTNRREFIAALGAAAWPFVARAQQKTFKIGVMSAGGIPPEANWRAFSDGFRELGWVEGKNCSDLDSVFEFDALDT